MNGKSKEVVRWGAVEDSWSSAGASVNNGHVSKALGGDGVEWFAAEL